MKKVKLANIEYEFDNDIKSKINNCISYIDNISTALFVLKNSKRIFVKEVL